MNARLGRWRLLLAAALAILGCALPAGASLVQPLERYAMAALCAPPARAVVSDTSTTLASAASHAYDDDADSRVNACGSTDVGVAGPVASPIDGTGELERSPKATRNSSRLLRTRFATEEAADVGALELPKSADVGVEGTSPNIRVETGGRDAAQSFFNRYAEGGVDVTPTGYGGTGGGQLVRIPDGSYVGIRYVSSYGDPVVDLNGADSPWRVHFGS